MSDAIIAYDLQNVTGDENIRVKAALLRYSNVVSHVNSPIGLGNIPEWVRLKLPDTTIFVKNVTVSPQQIVNEVLAIIQQEGALADKIYVGIIGQGTLWNASAQRINPTLFP